MANFDLDLQASILASIVILVIFRRNMLFNIIVPIFIYLARLEYIGCYGNLLRQQTFWLNDSIRIFELYFLSLCIYNLDGGAVSRSVTVLPVFILRYSNKDHSIERYSVELK